MGTDYIPATTLSKLTTCVCAQACHSQLLPTHTPPTNPFQVDNLFFLCLLLLHKPHTCTNLAESILLVICICGFKANYSVLDNP